MLALPVGSTHPKTLENPAQFLSARTRPESRVMPNQTHVGDVKQKNSRAVANSGGSDLLTRNEVGAALRIGLNASGELMARADFPSFKIGGSWRVHRHALESWIAAQTNGGEK
jgi:hypothetical protein